MSPDTIERWETGKAVPDADQFFALLAWLGVDPRDITRAPK